MNEVTWRLAAKIRSQYQSFAHSGLHSDAGSGQFNAGRAQAYREILTMLLTDLLDRSPTREEIAEWIAGPARRSVEPIRADLAVSVPADSPIPEAVLSSSYQ